MRRALTPKHKVKPKADEYAGMKGGGRKTAPKRGKGTLDPSLGGRAVTGFGMMPYPTRRPKSPEPDTVGRKTRPAAHNRRQGGVAKRAAKQVKRLGNRMI